MSKTRILVSLAFASLLPAVSFAQHMHSEGGKTDKQAAPKKMTDAQKIANAMSAAPAAIARNATIMDWPQKEGDKPRQLRAGNNGWVCFPNSPGQFGGASLADPMCLDKQWQAWGEAWMNKTKPNVTATGIGYMLKGDRGASNTDPFATGPTADNEWVVAPSHIMVVYPDTKMLDAFPTDPKSGGPWVMWKGTPYAHLMVPVSARAAAKMTASAATPSASAGKSNAGAGKPSASAGKSNAAAGKPGESAGK